MNKIKNRISLLLSLLIIFISLSPSAAFAVTGSSAATGLIKSPSVIGGNLGDWILDEADGYICAYSYDNDKLLFLSTSDLTLKNEIKLPGISDIELVGGKLYVALGSYRQIAVVDVKTATVESRYAVKESPDKIAVEGNKLFYILRHWTGEQAPDFTKLHILNLDDSSETEIKPSPDTAVQKGLTGGYLSGLTADHINHVLYIANSNDFSSGIFSISTKDFKTLSTNNGERFLGVYSSITLQGSDIFFGKYRLDSNDLGKVYGSYDSGVAYVRGDNVFAAGSVFDRGKFIKTGELPKDGDYNRYLMDSQGNVFLYDGESYSVAKGALDQYIIKNPGEAVPSISKWLVDADRGIIYALSRENNTLMFIGLNDLKLKKQIFVGKDPVDLTLANGKLFVALSAINQVAVVDPGTQAVKGNLVLKHRPGSLAVDGNKLFYMGYEEKPAHSSTSENYTRLYAYDLGSNSEKVITVADSTHSVFHFGESNMVLDASKHVLYLGAETGMGFCAINTSDYSIAGIADSFVVNQKLGVVTKAGDNVYYSTYKYAPGHLDAVYGYFSEPIIYAAGNLAFSKKTVYDAGNFEKVADLPFESDCLYLDGADNVYLYNKDLHDIEKYSLKPEIDGFAKVYEALVANTDYSMKNADDFNPGRKMRFQKMIVDDRKGYIYGISPDSYKLFVLGKDDLKVKKELMTGFRPKDMKLYNGKLYVAAAGTNYITVIDTASMTVVRKIYVSTSPELVAVDGDKLFYFGKYKFHAYDMSRNTEMDLAFHDFKLDWDLNYVTDMFVDNDNHILYCVRGAAAPGDNFAAINTIDLKPLQLPIKNQKPETVKLDGMPVLDGNDLFSGQTVYNRNDLSVISQGLKGKILYVDEKIIITSYSVYLRSNDARLGDLPLYMDNLFVDGSKNAYNLGSKLAIKKTSIYEMLNSLVNKTAAWKDLKIDDYKVTAVTFSDISSHWAKNDIEFLAARDIVKGKGIDGSTFSPDDRVTRAEFVAMLVRALGVNGSEAGKTDFSDVDSKSWYYSPVMAASSIGLVSGYGNGRFAPDATITREEIASLSVRALKYMKLPLETADGNALSIFNDKNNISGWARDNAAIAVKAGIIKGMPGGVFAPGSMTTRAEGAAILKRLLNYK